MSRPDIGDPVNELAEEPAAAVDGNADNGPDGTLTAEKAADENGGNA